MGDAKLKMAFREGVCAVACCALVPFVGAVHVRCRLNHAFPLFVAGFPFAVR